MSIFEQENLPQLTISILFFILLLGFIVSHRKNTANQKKRSVQASILSYKRRLLNYLQEGSDNWDEDDYDIVGYIEEELYKLELQLDILELEQEVQ